MAFNMIKQAYSFAGDLATMFDNMHLGGMTFGVDRRKTDLGYDEFVVVVYHNNEKVAEF